MARIPELPVTETLNDNASMAVDEIGQPTKSVKIGKMKEIFSDNATSQIPPTSGNNRKLAGMKLNYADIALKVPNGGDTYSYECMIQVNTSDEYNADPMTIRLKMKFTRQTSGIQMNMWGPSFSGNWGSLAIRGFQKNIDPNNGSGPIQDIEYINSPYFGTGTNSNLVEDSYIEYNVYTSWTGGTRAWAKLIDESETGLVNFDEELLPNANVLSMSQQEYDRQISEKYNPTLSRRELELGYANATELQLSKDGDKPTSAMPKSQIENTIENSKASNLYLDGSDWKYIANGEGTLTIIEQDGWHLFTAPTGVSNAIATLTEIFHIDATGNIVKGSIDSARGIEFPVYYQASVIKNTPLKVVSGGSGNLFFVTRAVAGEHTCFVSDADYSGGATGTAMVIGCNKQIDTTGQTIGAPVYTANSGDTLPYTFTKTSPKYQQIGTVTNVGGASDGAIGISVHQLQEEPTETCLAKDGSNAPETVTLQDLVAGSGSFGGDVTAKNINYISKEDVFEACGDSTTLGVGSFNHETSWADYLNAEIQFAGYTKHGLSGATCMYEPGRYRLIDQINAISPSATLITIMIGINDWALDLNVGDIDEVMAIDFANLVDTNSFTEALRLNVETALRNHPNAKIHLMTPLSNDNNRPYTQNLVDYVNAVIKVGNRLATPVIDVYNASGLWYGSSYFNDGLHPNDAGYALLKDFIKYSIISKSNLVSYPQIRPTDLLIEEIFEMNSATVENVRGINGLAVPFNIEAEVVVSALTASKVPSLSVKLKDQVGGQARPEFSFVKDGSLERYVQKWFPNERFYDNAVVDSSGVYSAVTRVDLDDLSTTFGGKVAINNTEYEQLTLTRALNGVGVAIAAYNNGGKIGLFSFNGYDNNSLVYYAGDPSVERFKIDGVSGAVTHGSAGTDLTKSALLGDIVGRELSNAFLHITTPPALTVGPTTYASPDGINYTARRLVGFTYGSALICTKAGWYMIATSNTLSNDTINTTTNLYVAKNWAGGAPSADDLNSLISRETDPADKGNVSSRWLVELAVGDSLDLVVNADKNSVTTLLTGTFDVVSRNL